MYSYLHIDGQKGTKKEPLLYLNTIVSDGYVQKLRAQFFNQHKEEDSLFSTYDISVNEQKDELTLNYQDQVDYDEYTGPVFEWKSKVYTFREALYSTLKVEYHNAIQNIYQHFEQGHEKKSIKAFFENALSIISEKYQRVETSAEHIEYLDMFKRFFARLSQKITQDYPAYLPKKLNPVIIALKKTQFDGNLIELPALQVSIFDKIKEIKGANGRYIFKIENPETVKLVFKNLIYGNHHKINTPINVLSDYKHITEAKYLISRILFYCSVFNDSYIKSDIFLLNGKIITVNSTYTAIYRMTHDKRAAKDFIDGLIQGHLS